MGPGSGSSAEGTRTGEKPLLMVMEEYDPSMFDSLSPIAELPSPYREEVGTGPGVNEVLVGPENPNSSQPGLPAASGSGPSLNPAGKEAVVEPSIHPAPAENFLPEERPLTKKEERARQRALERSAY
ncbi:hypothetical protein GUJ93_ZPchr0006g45909 [Zizania palustris]|uniref:Uncharacterized protein n=1 Tax=Zizania palustris TaxID=103762 RepID=A0A8J5T262_ZIZPA|nr:hypothetical protein GUJ93_ZPchr0006g45909 [Zizania palustris]